MNLRNTCIFTPYYDYRLEVPMMSGRFQLPHGYSTDLECQVLEIPFSQRRVSMFILLPDDPNTEGILKLETNLTSDNVKLLFSTLKVHTYSTAIKRPLYNLCGINIDQIIIDTNIAFRKRSLTCGCQDFKSEATLGHLFQTR